MHIIKSFVNFVNPPAIPHQQWTGEMIAKANNTSYRIQRIAGVCLIAAVACLALAAKTFYAKMMAPSVVVFLIAMLFFATLAEGLKRLADRHSHMNRGFNIIN